ncbi:MAG: NUDIX domain-containing protein [Candidatus Shapirobacteria bacterium]|nr:NUDIX domain-containing protein [Candidatus Shapirobacteria bacterium]
MIEKVDNGLYYDERSAGGIVFKKQDGRILWLIIKTLSKKYNHMAEKDRKEVYKFPKGHLLKDEVLKVAALREVEEEGRIKCQIVTKIGSNDYIIWDKLEKRRIIKKVTFFLMEYTEESRLKYYDNEVVLSREWLVFEEIIKKLSYDSEKVLLKKAKRKHEEILKP